MSKPFGAAMARPAIGGVSACATLREPARFMAGGRWMAWLLVAWRRAQQRRAARWLWQEALVYAASQPGYAADLAQAAQPGLPLPAEMPLLGAYPPDKLPAWWAVAASRWAVQSSRLTR